jgi:hypothetical protein
MAPPANMPLGAKVRLQAAAAQASTAVASVRQWLETDMLVDMLGNMGTMHTGYASLCDMHTLPLASTTPKQSSVIAWIHISTSVADLHPQMQQKNVHQQANPDKAHAVPVWVERGTHYAYKVHSTELHLRAQHSTARQPPPHLSLSSCGRSAATASTRAMADLASSVRAAAAAAAADFLPLVVDLGATWDASWPACENKREGWGGGGRRPCWWRAHLGWVWLH